MAFRKISRLSMAFVFGLLVCGAAGAGSSELQHTYRFSEPVLSTYTLHDDEGRPAVFDLIEVDGCRTTALTAGQPKLPSKGVALLLPQGETVDWVEVKTPIAHRFEAGVVPMPQQMQYPLSKPETAHYTPPDPAIYGSSRTFPASLVGELNFQRGKGYNLLFTRLEPVTFNAGDGSLMFYPEMTLLVHTKPLPADNSQILCRDKESDRAWIRHMVDNPEMVATYVPEVSAPRDTFEYVIITNQQLFGAAGPNNFQGLAAHKTAAGLTTSIQTVESIYSTYQGVDNQEKIRNFIIYAYNNWNTEYVLLGGDGDVSNAGGEAGNHIVPTRGFYCADSGYTDTGIPADMYYSCLDGTFNYNNNGYWGETNDGPSGGEVDLVAEVYVGRFAVDSAQELANMVAKTIMYENTPSDTPYLKRAYMLGELLWDRAGSDRTTYGDDYKEEIRTGSSSWGYTTAGFPADWTVGTLYDRAGTWGPSQLLPILNSNNLHVINHLGHANVDYDLRLYNSDADALTSTVPWFGYSQGCLAGAFDDIDDYGSQLNYDCILEHFTVNAHGPFAFVGNGRYGWGAFDSTDGASQYYDRQFFDAIFGEEIYNLGKVNADSKEDTIPWLSVDAHRWCYYELNLLGDPQTIFGGGMSRNGTIQLDRGCYPLEGSMAIQVSDRDLNVNPAAPDTATITVATAAGDSETVVLTETGPASCTFRGTLTLVGGTPQPGNGSLEVSDLGTITATYIDADDGSGHVNVPKTATATVDGSPPAISNLQVTAVSDTHATISWTTNERSDSTVSYGINPPYTVVTSSSPTLLHLVIIENLQPCTYYRFSISSTDGAGNRTTDDNGGSGYYLLTWDQMVMLNANMDTNPGWTVSGQWAWGVPTGQGGQYGCPDPTSGYTGANVYGYNLSGDYPNNMNRFNLVAGPFDCSQAQASKFEFMRWLGVEQNVYDHAYIDISVDGTMWTQLWENPAETIADGAWLPQQFDIAALADGQPTVYIRWGIGPSDTGWQFCGWNIDDVKISCAVPCDLPSPTPEPTEVPPTPTVTPTSIYSSTPTVLPTATPTAIPPTPPPNQPPQISITLNQDNFRVGDSFLLARHIVNGSQGVGVDEYIVLDVWGNYYFYPSWQTDIDNVNRFLTPGQTIDNTVLTFTWPDGGGAAYGLYFYAALCSQGSFNLLGTVDSVEFSFE